MCVPGDVEQGIRDVRCEGLVDIFIDRFVRVVHVGPPADNNAVRASTYVSNVARSDLPNVINHTFSIDSLWHYPSVKIIV